MPRLMTADQTPIKITQIVPHLRHGGAERMAVHLTTGLDPGRFEVSMIVLAGRTGSELEASLDKNGIVTKYLAKRSGFDARMFLRVRQALRETQPEVIHTHVHVLRYVLPYLLFCKRHIAIHTVHNVAEQEVEPRAQWLQRAAFRSGVVPISVAVEVAESLRRRYQIANSRVIPNCIPVGRYVRSEKLRQAWRTSAGIEPDDVAFTCVALFRPQKNHRRLIEAFRAGPAGDPRSRLLLVGTGPTEIAMRQLVERLGLNSKVKFLGICDNIPEILGASDVFVLSSDYEGNPLAVMEAMAAGLPVVSTGVGGVPELVTHGSDGLLIDRDDEVGFRNALQLLLDQNSVRKEMGLSAARTARMEFDLQLMIKGYEDVYQALYETGVSNAAVARIA